MELRGDQLRQWRKQLRLTQSAAALRLGLSQGYVSLLERGHRRVPKRLARKLARLYRLSPTVLPPGCATPTANAARDLASLGYPAFSHIHGRTVRNPAEVLVSALHSSPRDPRVVEALPWLLLRFPDLDFDWLVSEAKRHDLQNRLGFIVELAQGLARRRCNNQVVDRLHKLKLRLAYSRLAREEEFGRELSGDAEKQWVRSMRSPEAVYWNLLTDVSPDTLRQEKYGF